MTKRKVAKRQTTIYKILHRKKKIEKHEHGSKMVILGCPNQRLLYCHNSKCNNFVVLHYNFKHQVSNSNNYLFLYMCVYCEENKTIIVVFSILIHYYRYFRPPYILGLSQTRLHLSK